MNFIAGVLALLLLLPLLGCQMKPTRVVESPERVYTGTELMVPIKIESQTVIVDARRPFDYSMAHVPRSLNLQWSDFGDPEHPGLIFPDLNALTHRLALLGIGPETQVVVLGYGKHGAGEEGRIAWTLAYLGVRRVQFTDFDSLKFHLTSQVETDKVASVPDWKAVPAAHLLTGKDEVKFVINKRGVEHPVAFQDAPKAVAYRLIDVRAAGDYLGQNGFGQVVPVPNLDAVNIPWREFFDEQMRPNTQMVKKLDSVGINSEQRILVLSEDGVSSAAVTMALQAMGLHAANDADGLRGLFPRQFTQ